MFKKSTLLVALTFFLVAGVNTIVFTNSSQPPAGRTGAPGEFTCAASGCHDTNPASVTTFIGFDTAPTGRLTGGYTPGTTYNLFVNVNALPSNGSTPRNGFEVTVLDASNNAAGTLALSNPTLTTLSTAASRQYVGHNNANSTAAWTFQWTAPAIGTGDVTFYVAANISNNNSSDSGDKIYTQAFTFNESFVDPCENYNVFISTPGNATSFCTGQSLDLSAGSSGGAGGATYAWSTGGSSQTINVNAAGTYTVTVTEGTCVDSASIAITSVAAGVADFSVSVTNNVVTINNSSTGVDGNYTWDFGNGDSFADNSASFTYTYDSTGFYAISLSYTDVCGNSQTDMQQFTIDSVVGINNVNLADVLSVYPNPFGNQASININGHNGANYQFVMVDITGKVVRNLQGVAGTPLSINREGLQGGMYFYTITLDGETAQGKLLID